MKRISQLTELTTPAVDDEIPIVDKSTSTTKRIKVKNLAGIPDFGWSSPIETWAYSAWDSATKRGTITVPSDATTKYQRGMFVKFTQATGGTKYGVIISVTSTTIVVFMGSSTLNNETISDPFYSIAAHPFGLPGNVRNHNPFKFSAFRTAAQTPSAGAFTKVSINDEEYDDNGNFDAATNFRYTCPVDGIYHFTARLSNVANTVQVMALYKNGAVARRGTHINSTANQGGVISEQIKAVAGDYFELYVFSTAAAQLEALAEAKPKFAGYLVSES